MSWSDSIGLISHPSQNLSHYIYISSQRQSVLKYFDLPVCFFVLHLFTRQQHRNTLMKTQDKRRKNTTNRNRYNDKSPTSTPQSFTHFLEISPLACYSLVPKILTPSFPDLSSTHFLVTQSLTHSRRSHLLLVTLSYPYTHTFFPRSLLYFSLS